MSFNQKLVEYKKQIDLKLSDVYPNGPAVIQEPIYHILSGGKRLRPILCLLTTEACKGNLDIAFEVGINIELFHNFTLIHDDIMDEDVLRHGKTTIHNKWNNSIAILSGDGMLAIAMKRLSNMNIDNSEIIDRFHDALIRVCEGQALDIDYQYKSKVTLDEYIDMIDKKTGHLIGMCSELGGIISNVSNDNQAKLRKYGELLGRAFQIQDDLLEIVSNQDKMGKSLKSDFLLGKKTYISIKAKSIDEDYISHVLKEANEDYNKGFKLYLEFLNKHDIINDTKSYIAELLDNTNSLLSSVDINRENLHSFTKYVLKREY